MAQVYNTGADFVKDLIQVYGLLEGYRIAERYLEMQRNTQDAEEQRFTAEMKKFMNVVDCI